MKLGRKGVVLSLLAIVCIALKWYSTDAQRVEINYSNGFFNWYGAVLRNLFGSISFSIGDILYGLVGLFILYKLFSLIVKLFRRGNYLNKAWLRQFGYRILVVAAVIYIIFNISWGINYNREGIKTQLDIKTGDYNNEELKQINCLLIDKVNSAKAALVRSGQQYPTSAGLKQLVSNAYREISGKYPFLAYKPVSLKKSIWSEVGNYAGFSGYYNPFTAEAQFNSTIPKFLQPFTACHEVAHQLGYAKEQEANFVGYLAAAGSKDTILHYSVYLELFLYANRNLSAIDTATAKLYRKEIIGPVKDDLAEWVKFNNDHIGLLEPLVKWIYDVFLQSNEQPQGIMSYDKVTGFLIAYYKKFGKI